MAGDNGKPKSVNIGVPLGQLKIKSLTPKERAMVDGKRTAPIILPARKQQALRCPCGNMVFRNMIEATLDDSCARVVELICVICGTAVQLGPDLMLTGKSNLPPTKENL